MNYKIPFNIFDFFGYLITGFLFEVFLFLSVGVRINGIPPVDIYLKGGLIIISAYILGHIIALFASLIIEGFITKKLFGYPSENLFDDPKTNKKAYKKDFQEALKKAYKEKTGLSFDRNNFFKFAFHYVKESSPVTVARLGTFLNLYNFSRNLCMLFLIMAIWSFIDFFFLGWPVYLFSLFIVLSVIFYFRFLKFFNLFADEVFRSFYIALIER